MGHWLVLRAVHAVIRFQHGAAPTQHTAFHLPLLYDRAVDTTLFRYHTYRPHTYAYTHTVYTPPRNTRFTLRGYTHCTRFCVLYHARSAHYIAVTLRTLLPHGSTRTFFGFPAVTQHCPVVPLLLQDTTLPRHVGLIHTRTTRFPLRTGCTHYTVYTDTVGYQFLPHPFTHHPIYFLWTLPTTPFTIYPVPGSAYTQVTAYFTCG